MLIRLKITIYVPTINVVLAGMVPKPLNYVQFRNHITYGWDQAALFSPCFFTTNFLSKQASVEVVVAFIIVVSS